MGHITYFKLTHYPSLLPECKLRKVLTQLYFLFGKSFPANNAISLYKKPGFSQKKSYLSYSHMETFLLNFQPLISEPDFPPLILPAWYYTGQGQPDFNYCHVRLSTKRITVPFLFILLLDD